MLYAVRANTADAIEIARQHFEQLQLHAGSFVVTHVKDGRVIRLSYIKECEYISELLIPEFNIGKQANSELCLVASSAQTYYRVATDCILCTSYYGLMNFEQVYAELIERNIEIPDIRPELLLLELVATIYETDAEYSLEKLTDKLIEIAKKRSLTPTSIVIPVLQIRECCSNLYLIVISANQQENLFISTAKGIAEILYVPNELLEYPYIRKIVENYKQITIKPGTALTTRLGQEEVWYSLTKLQE